MGTQLAMFADTIIATFLPAGALSALYYADRLNQLPIGVIGIAIGTVLLPEMSRRITGGDHAGATGVAAPGVRFHVAVFGAVRGRLPDRPRCGHAGDVRARRFFRRRMRRRPARRLQPTRWASSPLCLIRSAVATFYARKNTATPVKAALTGLASQCRAQGGTGGLAGAGRSRARHRGRGLDQSSARDRICGAGRILRG